MGFLICVQRINFCKQHFISAFPFPRFLPLLESCNRGKCALCPAQSHIKVNEWSRRRDSQRKQGNGKTRVTLAERKTRLCIHTRLIEKLRPAHMRLASSSYHLLPSIIHSSSLTFLICPHTYIHTHIRATLSSFYLSIPLNALCASRLSHCVIYSVSTKL